MDSKQIHISIVACATLIATYATIKTVLGISDVYHTAVSFFEGSNPYYPWLFTIVAASVPIILFLIALLIYKNKKPIIVAILSAYSLLVYLSYPTIILIVLVAVWWFFIYSPKTPNKTLSRTDAENAPPG
jgi:hypothetical protein